jgi:aminoglycoside 2'-N-acetyltransferase I
VPEVRCITTAEASPGLLQEVRRLLVDVFARFSDDDWEHALGGHHVVVVDQGLVVAHAAVVPRLIEVDGRRFDAGYVESVATAPTRHGRGLGSLAMTEIGVTIRDRFELGVLSTGRHSFYERLGWERWRGPTFVRAGNEMIRTTDEDDGVMVLRFGPSAGVALTAPISCDQRSGDDW